MLGDELQTIKDRWTSFDQLVMMLAEGVDRGRGRAYGGLETLGSWNCAFLFTGEEPIAKANSGAGVKNRVLEVEASKKIIEDGNRTATVVKENFGFAGKRFINKLPSDEKLMEMFRELYENILKKDSDITEKQAVICAIVLLADRLSVKHIFKDKPLEYEDIRPFLATSTEVDMSNRAYNLIIDWVNANLNKFDEFSKYEIWGRITEDGYAAINRLTLNEFLTSKSIDFEAIKKGMAESGNLKLDNDGKYTISTRISGSVARMIHIKMDIDKDEYDLSRDDKAQDELWKIGR